MLFGYNTCVPGYQFSPMIWAGCSSNPFNTLNLMWNEGMMKLQCNSLLYQSPTLSFTQGGFFPLFGGNFSSIPNMLAQQTFSQFNMNNWWNNPTVGGVNNGFGFNFPNLFGNSNNGANNSVDSATTVEGTKLATLKNIYEKLRNESNSARLGKRFITEEMEKEYAEALKKETTNGKIDAIEAILKKIPAVRIQKVIMNDEKIKANLHYAGYNNTFASEKVFNWDDAIDELYRVIEKEEASVKGDKLCKFQGLINSRCASEITDNNDILQVISLWNDEYNKSSEKGLVRYIANHIPTKDVEKEPYKLAIKALSTALTNKANDYKEYSNVSEKKVAVQNIAEKLEKKFDKALALELADKCDALYAELRLMEAQAADKAIKEQYGFLNTEVKEGIVETNKILEETKKDLEKENIKVPSVTKLNNDSDDIDDGNNGKYNTVNFSSIDKLPANQKLDALVDAKYLEETSVDGVYSTATGSSHADEKFYGVKDGKLVEYVGVKSAEEITGTTPTKEVKKTENVDKYAKSVARIDKLIDEGLIEEMKLSDKAKGVRAYRSVQAKYVKYKGKDNKYHANAYQQHFVIMNDELVMIKDEKAAVSGNGWIDYTNGTKSHLSKLTTSDVKNFENKDVLQNKVKETANEKENDSSKLSANVETIVSQEFKNLTEIKHDVRNELGLIRLEVIGYYKDKKGNYYRYNKDAMHLELLENVKTISINGEIKYKNGKTGYCREVQNPISAGKELEKAIWMTKDDEYNIIRRKLNTFSAYTSTQNIYNFINSYKQNEGLLGKGICRSIAYKYDNLTEEEIKNFLQKIAQQVQKLALEAEMDESTYKELKNLDNYASGNIKKLYKKSGGDIGFGGSYNYVKEAEALDRIIDTIIKKYKKVVVDNDPSEINESEDAWIDE